MNHLLFFFSFFVSCVLFCGYILLFNLLCVIAFHQSILTQIFAFDPNLKSIYVLISPNIGNKKICLVKLRSNTFTDVI